MSGAKLEVSAEQLAAIVIIEAQLLGMNVAMQQLKGFLGMDAEAQAVADAQRLLIKSFEALRADWSRRVKLASAAELPRRLDG